MFLSPQYAVLYNVNIYLNFTSRHVVFFGGGWGGTEPIRVLLTTLRAIVKARVSHTQLLTTVLGS